jgi:hypothetical protein
LTAADSIEYSHDQVAFGEKNILKSGNALRVSKNGIDSSHEREAAQARHLIAALRSMKGMQTGQEMMISFEDETFVIAKAAREDIARIGCGYICFD